MTLHCVMKNGSWSYSWGMAWVVCYWSVVYEVIGFGFCGCQACVSLQGIFPCSHAYLNYGVSVGYYSCP